MPKAYTNLMALQLSLIAMKYEGSNKNPFQNPTPRTLIFLIAASCHVLASNTDMSLATTKFIFHASGIVACQALMWILLDHFLLCCIINVFLLLVASFCFNNYKPIYERIRGAAAPPTPTSETQEASDA